MFGLFRRRRGDETIRALYGAIVAQARQPAFYADYGVPDTVEGRFDMIVLHLALLVRRLRREEGEAARLLAQGVFDAFCNDMDHNLREMGLSDMAVPKRMRGFGEAFYGRAGVYDRALDAGGESELMAALARNVFGVSEEDMGGAGAGDAPRLAAYVQAAEADLAAQSGEAIIAGRLMFPVAGAIIAPAGAQV